ncbi:MAG TPA: response regulator [Thermoanaerobaculia bacterium]|nr:response regulator [Thermoanaerobaculia bacterium]
MSLLGRLEDLSLTDIVQIVFLSRRTGVLEIVDEKGRHTVLFRQGLVVNASSPEHPDLVAWFEANKLIPPNAGKMLRQMEENGIPYGTAAVELNLMSNEDLSNAVRDRIIDVVSPLLHSREGEFNFILSDQVNPLDIEYDADALFKEGGFAPGKILGAADGEKIKPLKGLEESLKAGKALLRGSASAETTPASLNLGLGQPLSPPETSRLPGTAPNATDNVLPFPAREDDEEPFGNTAADAPAAVPFAPPPGPAGEPPAATQKLAFTPPDAMRGAEPVTADIPRTRSGNFKVSGGLFEVESPDQAYRNVVLFERNPLIRVAAKRAFGKKGVKIVQYGSLDDVRSAITDLMRSNSFFVTFLELTEADLHPDASGPSVQTMVRLKKRNPRLPIVVIDNEADLRRRHALLRAGADLYLTKPSPARLQPGLAEEELALFADELVLFAERSFEQWEQFTGGFDPDAGKRFYDLAQKESLDRSFTVLKQLINELSNPNDIGQVAATILRLSAEYLDRGAIFMVGDGQFTGLGGFGITGDEEEMDVRVKAIRVPRKLPSLLSEVADSNGAHRGKMRRTAVNVELIEKLGGVLPTEVVALPIMHGGRTIGILYGDNAEHRASIDNTTGLEIFLSQAGYAFGNAVFAAEKAGGR